MVSDFLNAVTELKIFPIIGLIFFLLAFIGVIVWVVRLDKKSVQKWSKMPLDNGHKDDSKGEHDHE